MLRIVLKRSCIGIPPKQRKVIEALGLKKIGSAVRRADDNSTRGMINKVSHLVTVEETEE